MERIIPISVKDKIAQNLNNAPYVCGNSDYTVNFEFDEEWDEFELKTARFIKSDGNFIDVVFSGNQCEIPVIINTSSIYVGVYAGNLKTTTPAYIGVRKSILSGNGSPEEPSEDVYAQIMDVLNQTGKDAFNSAKSAANSAETAQKEAESAANSAKSANNSLENIERIKTEITDTAQLVDEWATVTEDAKAEAVNASSEAQAMLGDVGSTYEEWKSKVYGLTPIYITKKEFEALPEEEQQSGTYFITDDVQETDTSLTKYGMAADAGAVGERFSELDTELEGITTTVSDVANKAAAASDKAEDAFEAAALAEETVGKLEYSVNNYLADIDSLIGGTGITDLNALIGGE